MNRRQFLGGAAGLLALRRTLVGQGSPARLGDNIVVLGGGGSNVIAFQGADGLVLVDTGAPGSADAVKAALKQFAGDAAVRTVFNTHYHMEQTGNNEAFAAAGATIIAQQRTRQWMATKVWQPAENRYAQPRPAAALPAKTFLTAGSMQSGAEQIEYGYLPLAHTSGDLYVHFRTSNVLAVGDVASPVRDPELDYLTGAWMGGRVDAMDTLLKLANADTRVVPAYGPAMTRAELQAERDLMEEVRSRLWIKVREGMGPEEMFAVGVMNGLARTWKDPQKFLYAAAKGLWAHHDKLDHNVV